jgi:DNA mismatch repair protein MutL
VHPTKQEIKFEDEKIMYAFVGAAVKHALAQFSVAPSLDFSLNADIQSLDAVNKPFTTEKKEATASSSLYQTFTQKHQAHFIERENKGNLGHWKDFYEMPSKGETIAPKKPSIEILADTPFIQIHKTYIIASTNSGFVLIHQQLAHERVVYDKLVIAAQAAQIPTQKSLFPVTLSLSASDTAILSELLPDLQQIGYQVEPFGNNSFVIQGIPADVEPGNEKNAIELLIEQYKHFSSDITFSRREKIIRCMARQQAIKTGQTLGQKEMQALIESLFACTTPGVTPAGSPTYIEYKEDYLDQLFGK